MSLNSNRIFKLIDDYKPENNQTLIKYIKKNPLSLYNINEKNGMSVYSYASIKNIDCLYDIHETYLELKPDIFLEALKNSFSIKKFPYEIENSITKNKPIHETVERNLFKQVDYLINVVNVNVNHINKEGNTPLHIACQMGNIKIIELLLDVKDINLNIINKELNAPLSIAAKRKYIRIVELLLRKGALFKIIKQGKTKKFEFDIYADIVKQKREYPQIIKLFNQYRKKRREAELFKRLKKEYKNICYTLKNDIIDESIEKFAKKLGIVNIKNMQKSELCKKLKERLIIYQQNPNLIKDTI